MDEEGTKSQPTTIVVEKSSTKVSLEKSYKSRAATIIGAIQILCGIAACFSYNAHVLIVIGFPLGVIGPGTWMFVFFTISGSFTICSGKNTNSCLIISTMVMSILSAISAGILILVTAIWLDNGMAGWNVHVEVFLGIQLLAGIIELVLAITSAILSCKATCCRDKMSRDTTTPYKVVYKPDGDLDHQKIVSLALNIEQEDQEILPEDQEDQGKSFAHNNF